MLFIPLTHSNRWIRQHFLLLGVTETTKYCFFGQISQTINKATFGVIFSKVWPKSYIIAGFRGIVIYPYDPNILWSTEFAPSEISVRRTVDKDKKNVGQQKEYAAYATELAGMVTDTNILLNRLDQEKMQPSDL